jgi:hypothetical protein
LTLYYRRARSIRVMAWAAMAPGGGAADDDAALTLFRGKRLPSMRQLTEGGRVPVGPGRLQGDSRECVTDVPSDIKV